MKKNCVKVSGQLLPPVFDLPDDCWQVIFKFFNSDEKRRCLKSLSLVSKHFLSLTNPFHISLNVQILDLSNTALQFSRVNVKLYGMYFEFSKLEVLDLSHTEVYDEELYVISQACRGLLQLSMNNCLRVTDKGVKHVLENCTQLREINIALCRNVHPTVVASMVFLRPSLQKITVPPGCILSDTEKKLFKLQGCLVC
ncbi:uncharacterized protein LOC131651526 [Vicia villosa]|uniref:uncharacterized protein LOC131651526 n=1 Tax=Vicia villosa TaxID=3911 RepID=UPI00273B2ED0|nr:uncharacterized protein LOC131651526 [Vicia villosa]